MSYVLNWYMKADLLSLPELMKHDIEVTINRKTENWMALEVRTIVSPRAEL